MAPANTQSANEPARSHLVHSTAKTNNKSTNLRKNGIYCKTRQKKLLMITRKMIPITGRANSFLESFCMYLHSVSKTKRKV